MYIFYTVQYNESDESSAAQQNASYKIPSVLWGDKTFWLSTFLKSEKHFHLGLKVSLIAKTLEVCQENPSPTNVGDIV